MLGFNVADVACYSCCCCCCCQHDFGCVAFGCIAVVITVAVAVAVAVAPAAAAMKMFFFVKKNDFFYKKIIRKINANHHHCLANLFFTI